MNADAKLSRIRYLISRDLTERGYGELIGAFRDLDAHLSAGGTPPEAWRELPADDDVPGWVLPDPDSQEQYMRQYVTGTNAAE